MDSEVLLTVVVIGVSVSVLAVGVFTTLFVVLRRMGSQQSSQYESAPGRSDPRLPTNPDTTIGPSRWTGPSTGVQERTLLPSVDEYQVLTSAIEREYQQLNEAGYKPQLTELPVSAGEMPAYCFRTTGILARKNRTAIVYLVCDSQFPLVPPDTYAEVLSANDLDDYGQAKPKEVMLDPLQSILTWDQTVSSLTDVVREILNQLDETYHTTDQLSVFFNKYGELIRPHDS